MPCKRYAARVIGGFLHEVLHQGRTVSEAARDGVFTRQAGACWLKQFESSARAHLLQHLPQLVSHESSAASVQATGSERVSETACVPGHDTQEALSWRTWGVMLALVLPWLKSVPQAGRFVQVLERLQPELARLQPAAGVFRVPLHGRAHDPPGV